MSKLMAFISASAHLKWAVDFLFSNRFLRIPHPEKLCFSDPSVGLITHYRKSEASQEEDGDGDGDGDDCCSICLVNMKQREEVSKLRCDHLFHRPCLDRWFRSRGGPGRTCPLCRDNSLFRPREALPAADGSVQLLELRLVVGAGSDDRDSWWLR